MNRLTKIAAVLMFIAAFLCMIAPFNSDFANASMPLLAFFVLYAFFGWMVVQNRRWAKWLGFLLLLLGGIFGMGNYLGASAMPDWVTLGIWVASWASAVCLFVELWQDHVPANLPAQNEG